jgi:hypothetical protein
MLAADERLRRMTAVSDHGPVDVEHGVQEVFVAADQGL